MSLNHYNSTVVSDNLRLLYVYKFLRNLYLIVGGIMTTKTKHIIKCVVQLCSGFLLGLGTFGLFEYWGTPTIWWYMVCLLIGAVGWNYL